MRKFLLSAATIALLAACSPPAPNEKAETPTPPATVSACSEVVPDASRQVAIEPELAVAAAASDLRGGTITPGAYDLTRAVRTGAATGWEGTRAVGLDVVEDPAGAVTFNWASAAPGGERDTWTATLTEAPQPRLTYTCGRIGIVDAEFSAAANTLQLRLPDGANGSLLLDFQRRQ